MQLHYPDAPTVVNEGYVKADVSVSTRTLFTREVPWGVPSDRHTEHPWIPSLAANTNAVPTDAAPLPHCDEFDGAPGAAWPAGVGASAG